MPTSDVNNNHSAREATAHDHIIEDNHTGDNAVFFHQPSPTAAATVAMDYYSGSAAAGDDEETLRTVSASDKNVVIEKRSSHSVPFSSPNQPARQEPGVLGQLEEDEEEDMYPTEEGMFPTAVALVDDTTAEFHPGAPQPTAQQMVSHNSDDSADPLQQQKEEDTYNSYESQPDTTHEREEAEEDDVTPVLSNTATMTSAVEPSVPDQPQEPEPSHEAVSEKAEKDTPNATTGGAEEEEPQDDEFNEIERRARVALEAIAVRDEDVEMNMSSYVATLKVYRAACEGKHMYHEAHLIQQVLRNLRLEEETRHVRGLTDLQMSERQDLEDTHRDEFKEFHRQWNTKIDSFEEAQLEMEITLLERQNDELLKFHEEMRDYDPRSVPRFSRSLLTVRQKQQALAKQRSYVGAEEQKRRGDAIELMDLERYEHTRTQMYERREYALRYQHQQELLTLRMKVESRRLFLEKARKRELDEILQRYINARNEMSIQQNIIRNKTGALLLKHAQNDKTDHSGSAVLVESACSGAFGSVIQRRARASGGTGLNTTNPSFAGSSGMGSSCGQHEKDAGEPQRRLKSRSGKNTTAQQQQQQRQAAHMQSVASPSSTGSSSSPAVLQTVTRNRNAAARGQPAGASADTL